MAFNWGRVGSLALGMMVGGMVSTTAANRLSVTPTRVVVFKDGYSMVFKEAIGRVGEDARASISGIPASMVLGSFWILPDANRPGMMVSRQKTVRRSGENFEDRELELEFGKGMAGRDAKLRLAYFAPGIRWIPTYLVALGREGRADLLLQAEILNEMENLEDIPIDLVVGVPHFKFREVVSPLSLMGALKNPLPASSQPRIPAMSNAMFQQRAAEFRDPGEDSPVVGENIPALPGELSGSDVQDLFVYHVPKIKIGAGERAAVTLASATVPYRHLYTWDVDLKRSHSRRDPMEAGEPVVLSRQKVWHRIEITNVTGIPWSTGPAFSMEGNLPLGQELLTYTPSGATVRLPLTVAVDVEGGVSEEEVGREMEGIKFDGNSYAKISRKVTLKAKNHQKESVPLEIKLDFGGNATGATEKGAILRGDFQAEDWDDFRGPASLVGHSQVRWRLELNPGETKSVTCEYFYYMR